MKIIQIRTRGEIIYIPLSQLLNFKILTFNEPEICKIEITFKIGKIINSRDLFFGGQLDVFVNGFLRGQNNLICLENEQEAQDLWFKKQQEADNAFKEMFK